MIDFPHLLHTYSIQIVRKRICQKKDYFSAFTFGNYDVKRHQTPARFRAVSLKKPMHIHIGLKNLIFSEGIPESLTDSLLPYS